jgi:hypothetical protein
MSVYTLENLLWKDVENKIVTLAKHTIGGVPVKLAEKAIALGLADASTSPRAQRLIAAYGNSYVPVAPAVCHDLDTGAAPLPPPSRSSRYRGPANFTGELPSFIAKPAAATVSVAQRRLDGDKK